MATRKRPSRAVKLIDSVGTEQSADLGRVEQVSWRSTQVDVSGLLTLSGSSLRSEAALRLTAKAWTVLGDGTSLSASGELGVSADVPVLLRWVCDNRHSTPCLPPNCDRHTESRSRGSGHFRNILGRLK